MNTDSDDGASFFEAIKNAGQDNYLGSPEVVGEVLRKFFIAFMESALDRKKTGHADLIQRETEQIFAGENADYITLAGWHTPEGLGQDVIKYFDLDAEYLKGENMTCILSEGLCAVSTVLTGIIRKSIRQREIDWETEGQQRVQAVFDFVCVVFLGTASLMPEKKKLKDFGI